MARADAEAALVAAGLTVGAVTEQMSAEPPGTVLAQDIVKGASVVTGTAVALVLAVPFPEVPSVVGRIQRVATIFLERAGFVVSVTTEERTSGRNGIVLAQTPAGAELAEPGTVVELIVSKVVQPPPPPPEPRSCTSGYNPCLPPAPDYDCAGGSGDGPAYANGPIYVTGSDPYDLDSEGDGIACE